MAYDVPGLLGEVDRMIGVRVLARYTITHKLGEGGMGAVYVAVSSMDHKIVVKVLRAELAAQASMVQRFRAEAKAAAKIKHSNVVQILDADTLADGTHFIAMEFLDGKNLSEHMDSWGPLLAADVLPIVLQICAGLQAAHSRGVIHRDMKPENVFLCDEPDKGKVKILDFGIAKQTEPDADSMTRTGAVLGTPSYMAPEQARDPRSATTCADVFAVAVITYELLTGKRPYMADSLAGLFDAYAGIGAGLRPRPKLADVLREDRADVPPLWHETINNGISVAPASRPQTVREYIEPLYLSLRGGEQMARALAPSLLSTASPNDYTARAPGAPLVAVLSLQPAGDLGNATVSGVHTAPHAKPTALTTLHAASGAHSGPAIARAPMARRGLLAAAAALLLVGAVVAIAVTRGPSSSGASAGSSSDARTTDAAPATLIDAGAAVVIEAVADAAPITVDAGLSKSHRRTTRGKPNAPSPTIGDDIFR